MTSFFHFITALWYRPALNFTCRVCTALALMLGTAWFSGQMGMGFASLMTMPAALVSGLDQPGPKRWWRFGISGLCWGSGVALGLGMLMADAPTWLILFVLGGAFSSLALNGVFWARLGVSSLMIVGMVISLFNAEASMGRYPFLVLGPLVFSLFSWIWFAVWRHVALRACLVALYKGLSDYLQLRRRWLTGDVCVEGLLQKQKHGLVALFDQAFQAQSLGVKGKEGRRLTHELLHLSDLFEMAVVGHSRHPDLLEQFENPGNSGLLLAWSDCAEKVLRQKARALAANRVAKVSGKVKDHAEALVRGVADETLLPLYFWGRVVTRFSETLVTGKLLYERELPTKVPEQAWQWPGLRHPIWRHALRVGIVLGGGAAIATHFSLLRPEWVTLTSLMVMQSGFVATRSRIWQRCLGTVAGLLLAVGIIETGFGRSAIMGLCLVLLPLATTTLQFSYVVSIAAVSAFLVFLFELMAHQGLVMVLPRMVDTFVGAGLTMVGVGLLWPQWRGREITAKASQAVEKAGALLLFAVESLVRGAGEPVDLQALRQHRKEMLLAEHAWELVFSEMCQEPARTRREEDLHRGLLERHRQLVHYLTALVPLVRNGVRNERLGGNGSKVAQAVASVVSGLKNEEGPEFPALTGLETLRAHGAHREIAAATLVVLAVATLKQMNEALAEGQLFAGGVPAGGYDRPQGEHNGRTC